MKENVFDVLMYLFENYYMDDDQGLAADRDVVHQELSRAGFPSREIDRAFLWMEGLTSADAAQVKPAALSVRLYSSDEMNRIDTESRGFLLFLEQMGVLSPANRERAIEQAMALESDDFDLDQMKWVILMVLFNQPGGEDAYALVEDLVFDSTQRGLH
jgi:Smg protein